MAAILEFPSRIITFKFRDREIGIHTKDRESPNSIVLHASFHKSIKSNLFIYLIFAHESKANALSIDEKDI